MIKALTDEPILRSELEKIETADKPNFPTKSRRRLSQEKEAKNSVNNEKKYFDRIDKSQSKQSARKVCVKSIYKGQLRILVTHFWAAYGCVLSLML